MVHYLESAFTKLFFPLLFEVDLAALYYLLLNYLESILFEVYALRGGRRVTIET